MNSVISRVNSLKIRQKIDTIDTFISFSINLLKMKFNHKRIYISFLIMCSIAIVISDLELIMNNFGKDLTVNTNIYPYVFIITPGISSLRDGLMKILWPGFRLESQFKLIFGQINSNLSLIHI